MPAIAWGPLALKLLFNLALMVAQKMGVMNKVDASVASGAFNVEQFVSHLKSYSKNSDFPGEVHSDGV